MGPVRKRVLILDCDESILLPLEKSMEEEGFDTTTTWSTCDAFGLLQEREFDMVIVGDHPPEVDAGAVLRRVHRLRPAAECVVLEPATRFPFQPEYLQALGVRSVLARRAPAEVTRTLKALHPEISARPSSAPKRAAG